MRNEALGLTVGYLQKILEMEEDRLPRRDHMVLKQMEQHTGWYHALEDELTFWGIQTEQLENLSWTMIHQGYLSKTWK